ncbi:YdhK family protein [Paenibacillus albicereus]|uniref:YdhK family protein n=2 Tax=Paenibacillus albicereus TaxID=2726185 RepID=A0A6H2H3A0_9BACL|nr:YdhK family protein [Paenibacillus albicereus]
MVAAAALALLLAGCGAKSGDHGSMNMNAANSETASPMPGNEAATNGEAGGSAAHEGMNHGSGELPEGMQDAPSPKFPVGSQAILKTDHMPGMEGAEATIAGAYATTAYAVSYTPTTGGERVTNHKWVVQEELEGAGSAPYKPGDEVVLKADHMEGMDGAKATIDSAEPMTVYAVDYQPTDGGEIVKNHMWVTESELAKE